MLLYLIVYISGLQPFRAQDHFGRQKSEPSAAMLYVAKRGIPSVMVFYFINSKEVQLPLQDSITQFKYQ